MKKRVNLHWPRDPHNPVRRYWNPWYTIVWRALWLVPATVFRLAFVATVAAGWGPKCAASVWRDTE
jgi:hypothetical protein